MILQALTAYYEQLLRQGKIAAPGWDGRFKVSYELRLNDAGQLVDVVDLRVSETKGKKTVIVPRELRVPAHVKRTVGIAANFLCDNSSYLLGADEKGKPDRAKQCFEACAQLHHKLLDGVDDPAAKAILAYFDSWDPAQAAEHPLLNAEWKDLTGNANLIFGYEAPDHHHILANDAPAIQAAWQAHYGAADADAATMQCLITGKQAPAALVHPAIKGVMGAQSAGAALVSFNAPAFCSYGHEQGENAPVSEYAAFAYTTALNLLIADRNHCKRVGDTTIVCWAESAEPAYQDAFSLFLFGAEEASGIKETDVQAALRRLAAGQTVPFLEKELAPDQHFYVLGLAPNAARLSVRFFLRDTFGTFARNLQKHADALEITRPAYEKFDTLWPYTLARSAVRFSKDWKKADEELQKSFPRLSGDLLTSILNDTRYPATLLNGTVQRIRAEHDVTWARASVIKAYYSKNEDPLCPKEVLTVSVNKESTNIPYNLGRLFAVLERTQEAANPNINTTIKDRFFNSASATPSLVFPTLINLAQKHLAKLNEGQRIALDKSIGELSDKLGETFPKQLMLAEQGAFQLGYYQQRQEYFKKKTDTTEQKEEA